jgi:hypothetical protein
MSTPETVHAPYVGQRVLYTLTEGDAAEINRRRADYTRHRTIAGEATGTGHMAHVGNAAHAGQQFPGEVVAVFKPNSTTANLQVRLDGNDPYWATSRSEGAGPGYWQHYGKNYETQQD